MGYCVCSRAGSDAWLPIKTPSPQSWLQPGTRIISDCLREQATWYLLDSNSQPLVGGGGGSLPVLPFQEVWGRSFCRPLEKLVDIVTEYPSEVEHLFSPSCVSLRRCTGCCGDERLQCVPVEMANVTMQVGAGTVIQMC